MGKKMQSLALRYTISHRINWWMWHTKPGRFSGVPVQFDPAPMTAADRPNTSQMGVVEE
jgi:hypothetical protein